MAAVALPADPVFESMLRLKADLKKITSSADPRGTNAPNEVKTLYASAQELKNQIISEVNADKRAQGKLALHQIQLINIKLIPLKIGNDNQQL